MIQVLESNKKPSFGQKFINALGVGLQGANELYQQHQEKEALRGVLGNEGANLPRDFQKMAYESKLKQQQAANELQGNQQLISALEEQRGLPPGSLSGFLSNPSLAEQTSRPAKEPKKTQASQPIDPDQLKIIKDVRNSPEYKAADGLEKYQLMTDAGVSKENAQAEADIATKQSDITTKTTQEARKEAIKFHDETKDYDTKLLNEYKVSKKQNEIIKDVEKALDSGQVNPKSLANIFKGMGAVGDKLSEGLLNKNEAVIKSAIPEFLEGRKELFGVRLSDADLRLLQDKMVDIGKTPEANKAILRLMKKYAKAANLRYKIGKEIKGANQDLRPLGYADKIEERYEQMMTPVKIRNPSTGNVVEIPSYEASDYIKAGGELVNE